MMRNFDDRPDELHPTDNPRVIPPTEYPASAFPPYAGYKAPEGSKWYQDLHREVATPVDGGYYQTKYWYEKDGKKFYIPLDNNLKIDVAFPHLADQYRYGINYSQQTPANSRLFWSSPQRVARVKEMIDTMPEGETIPDWLDVDKLNTLYDYLDFKNPNKPYDQWAPLTEDDPAYSMLYQIPNPPQDIVSPYERDPVYVANKFLQDYQERYDPSKIEASVQRLMESQGLAYEDAQAQVMEEVEADFTKLEPYQQMLMAMNSLTPQDSNAPDWMKNVSAGAGAAKTAVASAGMTSMLTGGISALATTMGASTVGGPAAMAITAGVAIPLGVATYLAIKRGDEITANKLMALWNKPAEWTESIVGSLETSRQLRELGVNPTQFSPTDIFNASKAYYESNLYGIGNFEANAVSMIANKLNTEWSSGLQATSGQVWQFQKGLVEPQAIREGYLVGAPLAESVIRLASGEPDESVYWDMVDRYGYSGTRADYIAQSWIDPLQYVPFMTSVFGEKIAGTLKNPMLAESFRQSRGNVLLDAMPGSIQMPLSFIFSQHNRIGAKRGWNFWTLNTSRGIFDTLGTYSTTVKNQTYIDSLPISAYGVDQMPTWGKWLAGLDPKTGLPRKGVVDVHSQDYAVASGWAKLWSRTPEGTIDANIRMVDSALVYIRGLSQDPKDFMMNVRRIMDGAAYVRDNPNDPLAYAYDSPNARAIRTGITKAIQGDVVQTMEKLWDSTKHLRNNISQISDATGLSPAKLIEMMKNDQFSEIISKIDRNTATTDYLKNLTAEGLKRSTKTMLKNDIPYYPELMTAKLADAVLGTVADTYSKAYGTDVTKNSKLAKWLGLNKSVMSLAYLNTPNFTIKNLLNDFVVMGYDGVGSLFTRRYSVDVAKKYGVDMPATIKQGFGPVGKLPGDTTSAKGLVDYLQTDVVNKVRKLAIFTKLAGNIEGSAKMAAFTSGMDQDFNIVYKNGRPQMPQALRAELIQAGIDPEVLHTLLGSATKASDIDAVLGKATDPNIAAQTIKDLQARVDVDGALTNALNTLGIDDVSGRDMITKLAIADSVQRYITEEGLPPDIALSRTYEDLRDDAIQRYGQDVSDAYDAASQDMSVSGYGAAALVLDEINTTTKLAFMDNAWELADITQEASKIRANNPGITGRELSNALYNIRYEEMVEKTHYFLQEQRDKILAVVHRLSPDSEIETTLSDLLLRRNLLTEESHLWVLEENNKYWDVDSKLDYGRDVQPKIRQGQQDYVNRIEALDEQIDEQFIKMFEFDPLSKRKAEAFVANNKELRRRLAQIDKNALNKLNDLDEAGRRLVWQEALQKKQAVISEFSAKSLENGEALNQALRRAGLEGRRVGDQAPPASASSDTRRRGTVEPNNPPEPEVPDDWDSRPLYQSRPGEYPADQPYQGTNKIGELMVMREGNLRFEEFPDHEFNQAIVEAKAIHAKYINGWMKKNSDELIMTRQQIEKTFSLNSDEAKMALGILAYKAEDFAFRTGKRDPMDYIRRYKFESVSQTQLETLAKQAGLSSAGTAATDFDPRSAKWIIKASKKADVTSLFHELIHTWIFDLDHGDMVALNELFRYGTVEELYSNHRGWLTGRNNAGADFDDTAYGNYAARSERVVKIAEEYFYQRGTFNGPYSKGVAGLMQRFRNYIVGVMKNYRSAWDQPDNQHTNAYWQHEQWLNNNPISPEVEHALNRLFEGYRHDKVWIPGEALKRTPTLAKKFGDIFGIDNDDGFVMYHIANEDIEAYNTARADVNYRKLLKIENLQYFSEGNGKLELPYDLENNMPEYPANIKQLFGNPGPEPKTYIQHRTDLATLESQLFDIEPSTIKAINELSNQYLNKIITRPEAEALEAQRLYYEEAYNKVAVTNPIYDEEGIENLANNIIYWNSFRDSELYGLTPERLNTLYEDYIGRHSSLDPDAIEAAKRNFDNVYQLSLLVTQAANLHDRILNNPVMNWIEPKAKTYEPYEAVVYKQTTGQIQALEDIKKLITSHHSKIMVDGTAYYPKWILPDPFMKALHPELTNLDKPKPIKKQAPIIAPEETDPAWLGSWAITEDPKPNSKHQVPIKAFDDSRPYTHNDYMQTSMSRWPEGHAELLQAKVRSWLSNPEGLPIEPDQPLTFRHPFEGRSALEEIPSAEIDMALKDIMFGNLKDKKSPSQRAVLGAVIDHVRADGGNELSIRFGEYGQYLSNIHNFKTTWLDPLLMADQIGYFTWGHNKDSWAIRQALDVDNIQREYKNLFEEMRQFVVTSQKPGFPEAEARIMINKYDEVISAYRKAVANYLVFLKTTAPSYVTMESQGAKYTFENLRKYDVVPKYLEKGAFDEASLHIDPDAEAVNPNVGRAISEDWWDEIPGAKDYPLSELDPDADIMKPRAEYEPSPTIEAYDYAVNQGNRQNADLTMEALQGLSEVDLRSNENITPEQIQGLERIAAEGGELEQPALGAPTQPLEFREDLGLEYQRILNSMDDWPENMLTDTGKIVPVTAEETKDLRKQEIALKKIAETNTEIDLEYQSRALSDIAKQDAWNPIKLAESDPIVKASLEREKAFIDGVVKYEKDVKTHKTKTTKREYRVAEHEILYEMADAYYEWAQLHGGKLPDVQNDAFVTYMQRRVFPTLFKDYPDKKGSVYYDTLDFRLEYLMNIDYQMLKQRGYVDAVEYHRSSGKYIDWNEMVLEDEGYVALGEIPPTQFEPLPTKLEGFSKEFWKAYTGDDPQLKRDVADFGLNIAKSFINKDPTRLYDAGDLIAKLFPQHGRYFITDEQRNVMHKFTNSVYLLATEGLSRYTDEIRARGLLSVEDPNAPRYLYQPQDTNISEPIDKATLENTASHTPMGPNNSLAAVPPPFPSGRVMIDMLPNIKNIIDEMRSTIGNGGNNGIDANGFNRLSPAGRNSLQQYLNQTKGALASATQHAYDMGLIKADNSLLNYNDRTGMDDWLDVIFPYQFWFTRSMVNWAKRTINRPGILSQYANRLVHMERMGKHMGSLPLRLQGKMQIPWPFAEEWMGDNVYINPWMDLMPVNQILAPLEYMARQNTIDPTIELKRMLNEKYITREEYDYAMENQEGEHWDEAYAVTLEEVKNDTRPVDLASMIMSPNWLITEGLAKINNTPERNWPGTNMGYALQSHGGRIKDSGYQMVGDVLTGLGKLMELPEKAVRGERFVYYGEFGTYIINRELSSMAAEGYDSEACIKAMIEQKGELWDTANRRVLDQMSMKTPGSFFMQAVEEGDLTSIPLALLITMFPAGIFPEGELKQRGLSESFNEMWTKAGEGDTTWMAEWFDEHPEYLARSAINDSPRLMMKKFLLNQIMEYYTAQDSKNKNLFKEHLGEEFIDKVFSGESVDYDALDLEELTRWARMAKGQVPETPDTIGMQSALPEKDMPVIYDEQQLLELNTYFDERKRLFPDQGWQNKAYHNLTTKREKNIYLAKYPELKQYWEWNKAYQAQAPVVTEWLNRNVTETGETFDPYYGVSKELVDGYRAEKERLFPNSQWLNAEYFAIPSDNYNARRAFLAQYPELEQYWNWRNEVEAQSPQLKYYNAQMDAQFMEENAFPVAPADMAPNKIAEALEALGLNQYVSQDLLDYYVRGKPIPYGTLSYMKMLWEEAGKPDTLMEWIDNLF